MAPVEQLGDDGWAMLCAVLLYGTGICHYASIPLLFLLGGGGFFYFIIELVSDGRIHDTSMS